MSTKTATRIVKPAAQSNRRAPGDARFDVANRLFFRLYQASNLMHRTGTRAVAGHGATTQQWAVMGALSRAGIVETGMPVKELMAMLAVSRQSLTIVLNRMEGIGVVERMRLATDGRIRRVRLTAAGRVTWDKMLLEIRNYYTVAIADFSTEEAGQLFALLDRLAAKLNSL